MNEHTVWHAAQHIMPPHATADDAFHEALLPNQSRVRLYSVDTFVEDQHFNLSWMPPHAVAWRCLAAAVSDIAACGGTPLGWLLGLTLPHKRAGNKAFIHELYDGFSSATQAFAPTLELWGGDTTTGTHLVLSITVIGECAQGVSLKRSHAQPGDIIITNGYSGLAHLGWKAHEAGLSEAFPHAIHAFDFPVPELDSGKMLAGIAPNAALMDTSDGLADAALKIAHASGVYLQIEEALLPVHPEVSTALKQDIIKTSYEATLYGGEDFNLFGCLPIQHWNTHTEAFQQAGFYAIGHVLSAQAQAPGACLKQKDGTIMPFDFKHTFQHFVPYPPPHLEFI